MKLNGFKFSVIIALFLFSMGIFSACGDRSNFKAVFKDTSITMAINQEIDLNEFVELTNCSLQDLTFLSSDPSVVYVTPSYKLVSRNEGYSLITISGMADATLEVKVEGTEIAFNAPSNIRYDETKNALVWDSVYAGNTVATTYQVKIKKDNGEEITKQTNKNYYEILEAGSYTVKVSCLGRAGVLDSEFSAEYAFEKLDSPTNLLYYDSIGKLTWSSATATHFRVFVNGVSSEVLSQKEYLLNLQPAGNYEILVMACAEDDSQSVFGATSVEKLSLTRLSSPELSITNGVISWTGQEGVSNYELSVPGSNTPVIINKNSSNVYTYGLPGIDITGINNITVKAIGDSTNFEFDSSKKYLNSQASSISVEKLSTLQLGFDYANEKLFINNYDSTKGLNVLLNVVYNGQLVTNNSNINSLIDENGFFEYDFNSNSGKYEFTIINGFKNINQINSDSSNKITINKLSAPTNPTHAFITDANGDERYVVDNYKIVEDVEGVNIEYEIEIQTPEKVINLSESNNIVNDLFKVAGSYPVRIYAKATSDEASNIYYLNSEVNQTLNVIRLNNITYTKNENIETIICDKLNDVPTAVNSLAYRYELYLVNGEESLVKSGQLTNQEFNYSDLTAGSYKLKVWATGSSNHSQIAVLSSITKTEISFTKTTKLGMPTINWSVDENRNYFIEITAVDNANAYDIWCNDSACNDALGQGVETANGLKYNVTSIFNSEGAGENKNEYIFEVVARKEGDNYFENSLAQSIKVIRADAPNTFDLNVETTTTGVIESILSVVDSEWFLSTQYLIYNEENGNYQETNILNPTQDNIRAKIKYLANSENMSNGAGIDIYYIDSNYAELNFNRVNANLSINGSIINWWTNNVDISNFNVKLFAKVNGELRQPVDITNKSNNQFDLTEINGVGLQELQNAEISVVYAANSLKEQRVGGTYYLSSYKNTINVYTSDEMDLEVSESGSVVSVDWVKTVGAIYTLNGSNSFELNADTFVAGNANVFSIEEILDTQRNIYLFAIERLAQVNTININANEEINLSDVSLPVGAQLMVVTDGNNGIENFATFEYGTLTIYAQYLAQAEPINSKFYLNSLKSDFTFKRLTNLSNLNISSNQISWNKEESGANAYSYKAIFSDHNESTDNLVISLSATANTSGLELLGNQEISEFIYNAESGKKYFGVQKVVETSISAQMGGTYYLSQKDSTIERVELEILEAPQNISISASGEAQQNISLTWDSYDLPNGYEKGKFVINVEGPQNKLLEVDGFGENAELNELLKTSGEWTISVMVKGENETISSPYSMPVKITRLEEVSNISISVDGVIKWQKVENAESYKLIYSYNNGAVLKTILSTDTNGSGDALIFEDGSYLVCNEFKNNEISENFEGNIIVKVVAVGTGVADSLVDGTLTSSTEKTFSRLGTALATFGNTGISIENFNALAGQNINLEIFVNGEFAKKEVMTSANWLYPDVFYTQGGEPIDLTKTNVISFNIYVTSNANNVVSSNVITQEVTKLAKLSNLHFVREGDVNNGVVKFKLNNSNSEGTIVVGLAGKNYNLSEIVITDEILAEINTNWQIEAYVQGGLKSGVIYIDSAKSIISGKKLSPVPIIGTNDNNTGIEWQKVNYASSYNLAIYSLDNETQNVVNKTELFENMATYSAGKYTFAVRAIGNIGNSQVTENVILDSLPTNSQEITKLSQIQNVNVQNGYFVMDEVVGASSLVAVLFENTNGEASGQEYELIKSSYPTTDLGSGNHYYSEQIISKLAGGKEYYVRFYAKASESNFISSNYADIVGTNSTENYLKIKIFSEEDNVITLNHKMDEGGVKDYTVTYAQFNTNADVSNGIIIQIKDSGNASSTFVSNSLTYTLDKDGDWMAGQHLIKYAQIGSTGVNADRSVYLTKFGNETKVTKLAKPILGIGTSTVQNGSVAENVITINSGDGASQAYIYIANNLYTIIDGAQTSINLSSLSAGTYNSVAAKSTSKILGVLASGVSYLQNENDENIKILKQNELDKASVANGALTVDGGAFVFKPTALQLISLYTGNTLNEPFLTTKDLISNQFIQFKFKNTNTGVVYYFVDYVINYIYLTEDVLSLLGSYADEIKKMQMGGFPSLKYNFLDFAEGIAFGEYEVQARIIGNFQVNDGNSDIPVITSNYSTVTTKYIPNAPNVRIENNSGIFNLKFENVIVNTNYYQSTKPIYTLVGIYKDEGGQTQRKEIAFVEPANINDSGETISINLTELIENGTLTNDYVGLYVYVKGNDSSAVINGKCSNQINIVVLEQVNAYVKRGIITWAAQTSATKYVINYANGEEPVNIVASNEKTEYEWICSELAQGTTYSVSIQAYGSQGVNASAGNTVILSGPVTNIGNITKLNTISTEENGIDIERGAYKWAVVEEATDYDVFVNSQETYEENKILYIKDGNCYYETSTSAQSLYYFRAVGTQYEVLSSQTDVYVNSELSAVNYGVPYKQIENLGFTNGVITWTSVPSQKLYVRFIFSEIDNEGNINGENIEINVAASLGSLDTNEYPELHNAARYKVAAQTYLDANKYEVETANGSEVYYLMSLAQTKTFHKFASVNSISVNNGVVSWNYNGISNVAHYFKLIFSYEDLNGGTVSVNKFVQGTNGGTNYQFEDIVFEDDIGTATPIALKIVVEPGLIPADANDKTHIEYVKSLPLTYNEEIYQFDKINESNINISLTNSGQILIDWEGPDDKGQIQNCKYEIIFSTGNAGDEKSIFVQNSQILCGEGNDISFNYNEGYSLYFKIRIIPADVNYISSSWSNGIEIKKPSKITGFSYADYTYTWNEYSASAGYGDSFGYKIKDEIGYINDQGEFVVQNIYIYDANLGDEKFSPSQIGHHRVSVAVYIKSSHLISDYCYVSDETNNAEDDIININMFDSGSGTKLDPYIISSTENFANMKYRATKDSKNNAYYKNIEGDLTAFEENQTIVNQEDEIYHFKQNGDMVVNAENAILDEFNGDYNGDFYSITLNLIQLNADEEEYTSLGSNIYIFAKIGTNGKVQNLALHMSLAKTINTKSVTNLSLLARENAGSISNIVVGNSGESINFGNNIQHNLTMTFIAYNNNGTIENVYNNYDVSIETSNDIASIQFAAIAINNKSSIKRVKNFGDVFVSAGTVYIGGIALSMTANSTLTHSANVGNIKSYIRTGCSASVPSKIGGLVAQTSDSITFKYNYVVADISIYYSTTISQTNYIVGGLIGESKGNSNSVQYSYVDFTINKNVGTGVAYESIYAVVGSLVSFSGSFENVYYNDSFDNNLENEDEKLVNGAWSYGSLIRYAQNLTTNEMSTEFVDVTGQNPMLAWELEFEKNSWK